MTITRFSEELSALLDQIKDLNGLTSRHHAARFAVLLMTKPSGMSIEQIKEATLADSRRGRPSKKGAQNV